MSILEIKQGDKIKCLNCKKLILINTNTFKFDEIGEYILCPICNKVYSTDFYHIQGEKIFNLKN